MVSEGLYVFSMLFVVSCAFVVAISFYLSLEVGLVASSTDQILIFSFLCHRCYIMVSEDLIFLFIVCYQKRAPTYVVSDFTSEISVIRM